MRVANLVFATAALCCILSARTASAQVVFGQANINTYANAVAYASAYSAEYKSSSSFPGPVTFSPSTISTEAQALAIDNSVPFTDPFASVEADGTALFNSAAMGQVQFTGVQSASSDNATSFAYATGGGDFVYFFQTPTPATLDVSYNLLSRNIGCCEVFVDVLDINTGNYVFYQTIYGASNAGLVTASLTAGDNYYLYISDLKSPYYDGATASGVAESYVGYDDRYSFTISTVSGAPEPSSWALMIAGVGLVGGVLRRRRTPAAVPSETAIAA